MGITSEKSNSKSKKKKKDKKKSKKKKYLKKNPEKDSSGNEDDEEKISDDSSKRKRKNKKAKKISSKIEKKRNLENKISDKRKKNKKRSKSKRLSEVKDSEENLGDSDKKRRKDKKLKNKSKNCETLKKETSEHVELYPCTPSKENEMEKLSQKNKKAISPNLKKDRPRKTQDILNTIKKKDTSSDDVHESNEKSDKSRVKIIKEDEEIEINKSKRNEVETEPTTIRRSARSRAKNSSIDLKDTKKPSKPISTLHQDDETKDKLIVKQSPKEKN